MYDIIRESSYLPPPFANSPLFPLLLMSLATQKNAPSNTQTASSIRSSYDFIIVGAGSAGATVAARLSELPCVNVLLLEAGKKPPVVNDVPFFGRAFWLTDLDWTYKTTPQRYTGRLLKDRQVPWPLGKGLGGSGLINAELYVRGNKKNYDDWEQQGAKGWSYEEVLPYFKKLEDFRYPEFLLNGRHATSGPITIEKPKYYPNIKGPLYEAVESIGYEILDSNGPRQTGFYDTEANTRDGQRCSAAKGYLVPAENRTNLHILPNAFVHKIIIQSKTAVGVSFKVNGQMYDVFAKKEVIVSAGSTKTPQLLMLSGIGPQKDLQRLGIPAIANLPVGLNLQEHCSTYNSFEVYSNNMNPSPEEAIETFIENRSGYLASPEGVIALAFLKDSYIRPKIDFPNYELYFFLGSAADLKRNFNIQEYALDQIFAPYENKTFLTCFASVIQPKSRGYVKLLSSNPEDPPLIDPNYFANPQDLKDMVEGMKTCHRIAMTKPLQNVGARPFQTVYPGCEKYLGNTDGYFACQAGSIVTTMSHAVGTAKMGAINDPSTVVDPELKVKGIKHLRVVDASIMPIVPSGNTNIPTIMVAEKASDIIKSTLRC